MGVRQATHTYSQAPHTPAASLILSSHPPSSFSSLFSPSLFPSLFPSLPSSFLSFPLYLSFKFLTCLFMSYLFVFILPYLLLCNLTFPCFSFLPFLLPSSLPPFLSSSLPSCLPAFLPTCLTELNARKPWTPLPLATSSQINKEERRRKGNTVNSLY